MSAIFSKQFLSESTNGRPIKVTATSTPGTLIHTAVAGTVDKEEIYLYAVNTDSSDHTLTIEFGGTTSPDDLIPVTLEANKGLYLVIPGWTLQNGLEIRAFADGANVVNVGGYIHLIKEQ